MKHLLLELLRKKLVDDLSTLMAATEAAREAATHTESKPENKYDTRGLEASYIAGAQAERVAELQSAIHLLSTIAPRSFGPSDKIAPTAVVTTMREGAQQMYFLLPVGGGTRLDANGQTVVVVTPSAPIGRGLLGKRAGDVAVIGSSDLEILSVF